MNMLQGFILVLLIIHYSIMMSFVWVMSHIPHPGRSGSIDWAFITLWPIYFARMYRRGDLSIRVPVILFVLLIIAFVLAGWLL
jgi:hypothetical protein